MCSDIATINKRLRELHDKLGEVIGNDSVPLQDRATTTQHLLHEILVLHDRWTKLMRDGKRDEDASPAS